MYMEFFSLFSRAVIGIVFLISFTGKVRDFSSFVLTITKFRLTPREISMQIAVLVLAGEFLVVLMMIFDGQLLRLGFALAIIMLSIFSFVLLSAVVRRVDAACNCFGSLARDHGPVYGIIRNVCFILCALLGYLLAIQVHSPFSSVLVFVAVALSLFLVLIMLNLNLVLQAFRDSFTNLTQGK